MKSVPVLCLLIAVAMAADKLTLATLVSPEEYGDNLDLATSDMNDQKVVLDIAELAKIAAEEVYIAAQELEDSTSADAVTACVQSTRTGDTSRLDAAVESLETNYDAQLSLQEATDAYVEANTVYNNEYSLFSELQAIVNNIIQQQLEDTAPIRSR